MRTFVLAIVASVFSIFVHADEDFSHLMGKDTPVWKYVQTSEDSTRLEFFRALFEKQVELLAKESEAGSGIPKVLHFIWLGPDPISQKAQKRIAKWKALHPEWIYKLWVDREKKMEGVEVSLFDYTFFTELADAYYDSVSGEEREKILAYEILLQEGGVYVDYGMDPFKAFDSLNERLDFYCGLQKLGPSVLSTSVVASTNLIAAKAQHPILKEATGWLSKNWDQLEGYYPGKSQVASQNRIWHRTFWALSEGIDRGINRELSRDVVFPTEYFHNTQRKVASYAVQYNDFKETTSRFEAGIQKQLKEVIKKENEAVMITLFLAVVSFFGCLFLLFYVRTERRSA